MMMREEGEEWSFSQLTMADSGDPGASWLRLGGDQPETDFCLYQGRRVVMAKKRKRVEVRMVAVLAGKEVVVKEEMTRPKQRARRGRATRKWWG